MVLIAGLLACLTLWWLSKNSGGLGRRLARAAGQGVGAAFGPARLPTFGAFALLAAGFLLLRGNLVPGGAPRPRRRLDDRGAGDDDRRG